MAKHPALLFYVDAHLADTRHLSTLEQGAYLLLLMTAWLNSDCSLPDDEKFLAKSAGLDLRTWKKHRDVVMEFWYLDDNQRWRQARLDITRRKADEIRSKKSYAGTVSALKKKERQSTPVEQNRNRNSTNTNYYTNQQPNIEFKKEDSFANIYTERMENLQAILGERLLTNNQITDKWINDDRFESIAEAIIKARNACYQKKGIYPKSLKYYEKVIGNQFRIW